MQKDFSGKGKVKLDTGNEYDCTFVIHHFESGRIEVSIKTMGSYIAISQDFGFLTNSSIKKVMLSGQTNEGYTLNTQMAVRKTEGDGINGVFDFICISDSITLNSPYTSEPSSYSCYLTNLLFYGTHKTALANDGWTLNRLPFQFIGRDCELMLLEDRQLLRDRFEENKIQITSVLTIPFKTGDNFHSIQAELFDICDLLSFAQGCFVSCVRIDEIGTSGTILTINLLSTKTRSFVGGFETIPDNTPAEPHLKLFLECSLPSYKIHKSPLQLKVFLTYYLEAKLHKTRSIKFLLACIAAEAMKSNFQSWKTLPRNNFRNLLTATFDNFGLTGEVFPFIDFRNSVVHTGDENLSFTDWKREHFKLTNQLDRLFLCICSYHGKYYDISDNFAVKVI